MDRGEHSSKDQTDEGSADARDVVDAQGQTALIRGECVRQDRGGICHQERGTDALEEPADDEPGGPGRPRERIERQQQRGNRVEDKPEVVHLHAPEYVPEAPKTDDQDASDDLIAEDHPKQIKVLPGSSGFNWMPRKMVGIAMNMIDESMVASSTPMVVLESAIHL